MDKILKLLKNGPKVINVGLKSFYEANQTQNVSSVHVDWAPPGSGDKELIKLLDKLI